MVGDRLYCQRLSWIREPYTPCRLRRSQQYHAHRRGRVNGLLERERTCRDFHKLNVGITRGRFDLIVFGHQQTLLGTAIKKVAVSQLMANAVNRKLVLRDFKTLESHPEGVKLRKDWDAAKARSKENKAKKIDYSFIGKMIREAQQ